MSNARMRLVLLDVEGTADELQAVLRAALTAAPGTTVTHEAVNVALVEANGIRRALPVAPRKTPGPKPNAQQPPAADPKEPPAMGTIPQARSVRSDAGHGAITAAVLRVLRNGPLDFRGSIRGHPEDSSGNTAGSVYQMLRRLTARGEVEKTTKSDEDRTTAWRKAQP